MRGPVVLLRRSVALALQLFYPPQCLHCQSSLFGCEPAALCSRCLAGIRWIGDGACGLCGSPAGEFADLGKGCAACRPHALRFTRAVAAAAYGPVSRRVVHGLKFHGQRHLASPMARAMALRVRATGLMDKVDSILPVPLHPNRMRDRGYNQALLLARELSRHLQRPLQTDILHRIRDTRAQALLHVAERVKNPLGAFAVVGSPPKRVLLVDDVLTTGTTVSECAGILREAGAERVYVTVFAR